MERQEIVEGLVEILKTVRAIDQTKLNNITEETDFIADLNTPSTEMINIATKAEQKFNVEFDDDDIDDLGSTVKDFVDLIVVVVDLIVDFENIDVLEYGDNYYNLKFSLEKILKRSVDLLEEKAIKKSVFQREFESK